MSPLKIQAASWRKKNNPMPEQVIQSTENLERTEAASREKDSPAVFDIAMARIWIELFTRATLYAGAIGLIAGMAAVLLLRD